MKISLFLLVLILSRFCLSMPIEAATDSVIKNANQNSLSSFTELYSACSNVSESQALFKKIDRRTQSTKLRALNRIALALVIDKRGNHELAMTTIIKLKEIHEYDDYVKAEYYGAIGQINYSSENPELAKKYHLKSIKLLLNTDQKVTLHKQYMRLGQVYTALKQYEKAIESYNKALAIEGDLPAKQTLYLSLNIAMTNTYLGRNSEAKSYFHAALTQLIEQQDYFAEIRTYRNLGDIYLAEDSLDLAEKFFLKGMNLAKKRGYKTDLIGFNYSLALLREQQSRFQDAYTYYRSYDSLRESVKLVETAQSVIKLEMKNELSIKKVEKEAQDKLLKIKSQKNQLLIGSSIVLMLLLVIIIRQLLIVKQKNRILLRKNLSEDLRQKRKLSPLYAKKDYSDYEPLINSLEQLVHKDHFFQKSDLTQEKVAKKLGTNRTYLSEAINNHYKMGYSRWINEVRIKESKKMLTSEKYAHFSIEGISKTVGFSSLSAFNSNFKSITGLTPSYYRNNYLSTFKTTSYALD